MFMPLQQKKKKKKKKKIARPKAVGLEQNGRSLGTTGIILTEGAWEKIIVRSSQGIHHDMLVQSRITNPIVQNRKVRGGWRAQTRLSQEQRLCL
jgi:hypothetical protein